MGFKCISCGKITEKLEGRIRCPFCGYRIFAKETPRTVVNAKTR